ncbi:MAG: hypothetical protein AAF790_08545 [Planctomycetota bacterium]
MSPAPIKPTATLPAGPSGPPVVVTCRDGGQICEGHLGRLEALDDAVFAALAGDASSFDEAARLWRQARQAAAGRLPAGLVEESRRQYVRHAQAVLSGKTLPPAPTPEQKLAATQVLALLAE